MRKAICSLCLVFLLSACTTVSFLPTKDTVYQPTTHVEIYFQEPEEPYIIIGQLIATSDASSGEAFKYLKNKAMEMGAHAIIMKGAEGIPMSGELYGIPYIANRLEAFAIRFE